MMSQSPLQKEDSMPKTTVRSTYDTNVSNNPLVVLRKVDWDLLDDASIRLIAGAQIDYRTPEATLAWFRDGYVLNDQPRSGGLAQELIEATVCFAVGRTDNQTIMADGLSLAVAENAVNKAEIKLNLAIDIPETPSPKAGIKAAQAGKAKNDKAAAAIDALEAEQAALDAAESAADEVG